MNSETLVKIKEIEFSTSNLCSKNKYVATLG